MIALYLVTSSLFFGGACALNVYFACTTGGPMNALAAGMALVILISNAVLIRG